MSDSHLASAMPKCRDTRGVRWTRAGMLLAFVFALVTFCVTHCTEIADSMRKVNGTTLVIVVTTLGLQWYIGGLRDLLLLQRLTPSHVRFHRIVVLNAQQYLFNLLPLATGTLYKAVRYREELRVPYAQFGAVFLVQYVILVGVSTAWAVAAAIRLGHSAIATLFLGVFVASLLLLFLPKRLAHIAPRSARRKLIEIHQGIVPMYSNTKMFLAVLSLGIVCHGLQCLRLFALLSCVDPAIAFSDALLYAAMAHLSLLLMITPSGLGVREFLFAVVATSTDHSVTATVLAALVERVVAVMCALGIASLSGFSKFREVDSVNLEFKETVSK